jgi:type IX secretion system substrate protein
LPDNNGFFSGAIFDITGREVQSLFDGLHVSNFSFSTSTLSAGMYFVRITSKSSAESAIWMGKMVKE